jgi:hypothetical protein
MILGFLLSKRIVAEPDRAQLSPSGSRLLRCSLGPARDGVDPDLAPVLAAAHIEGIAQAAAFAFEFLFHDLAGVCLLRDTARLSGASRPIPELRWRKDRARRMTCKEEIRSTRIAPAVARNRGQTWCLAFDRLASFLLADEAQLEHCRDYANSQGGNLKMQSRGVFRETKTKRQTWC